MAGLFEYILLATTSLLVITDPIATVPAFLAMTQHDSTASRVRTARLACFVAAGILVMFVVVGERLFRLLGITISAFKIAGSIVLLLIAIDMLRAQRSPVQETSEEKEAGAEKADIAITPLAVPMLAGPGAISTVILLKSQAKGIGQSLALVFCVCVVCFTSYWVLRLAATHGVRLFTPIAMKLTTRIMGLLLAALAIQFILDGIAEQKGKLFLRDQAPSATHLGGSVNWRLSWGREKQNTAPFPGSASAEMHPPCASTYRRTIASPIPLPGYSALL
jgi:multiple antibiotic resistance protein